MAQLPRYQSSGIAVGTPQGQFRDVSAPFEQLSAQMNRMTDFYLSQAEKQAVYEGERYGAENAPSAEQLVEAYQSGAVLEPVGDPTTVFGRAALKSSQEIVRTNMYYASHTELTKISNQIELGQLSPDAGLKQMNSMIDGFSQAVSQFDPTESRKIRAELAYKANTHYLAATKKAAANSINEAKLATAQEIDARIQSLPTILAAGDRTDPTTGKVTSVLELMSLERKKIQDLGGRVSRTVMNEAIKAFDKKFLDARNDYVKTIALGFGTDEDREKFLTQLKQFPQGKSTGNKSLDSVLSSFQPDEYISAVKSIREISEMTAADTKRAVEAENMKLKAQYEPIRTDFLSRLARMESGDLSNRLTASDILTSNLPAEGDGSKATYLARLSKLNEGPIKTDPLTYIELISKVNSGEIYDVNQLEPYIRDKKLGLSEIDNIKSMITSADKAESKALTNFIKSAESIIVDKDPLTGIQDPKGLDSFAAFQFAFMKKYKEARAAGVPFEDLLNPTNKEHGQKNWDMMRSYKRPLQDIIQSMVLSAKESQVEIPTLTQDEINALPSGKNTKFIAAGDPTKAVRTKP